MFTHRDTSVSFYSCILLNLLQCKPFTSSKHCTKSKQKQTLYCQFYYNTFT
ncbi:hypothetical protein CLOSTMETH_03336 [[Clostridium] methylpentosum DSM 5476]|uniref:Uncharacterized protein n=1 Tax=[Clostridium] methylpentosum DSM 5476 TaxID=537013 RepID=C0EHJ2_9FIRM|nr:hypothetical protein CLOSTMETH_03336 [[Clostridium] methylpentosum DSM 5476]